MIVIYINQEKVSNKFWSYEIIGNNVKVRWGRIGGTEDEQIKEFPTVSARDTFISKKTQEKIKKGYKRSDSKALQAEEETASELGARYKIQKIQWVDKKKSTLNFIGSYDPEKYIYVEILNSWTKEVTRYLLNKTTSWRISTISEATRSIICEDLYETSDQTINAIRSYLRRLARQVQEVTTVKFAAIGRVINLGLGDDDDNTPRVGKDPLDDLMLSVSGNASTQVVRKFAALGRELVI